MEIHTDDWKRRERPFDWRHLETWRIKTEIKPFDEQIDSALNNRYSQWTISSAYFDTAFWKY